jgi:hypothetical protein
VIAVTEIRSRSAMLRCRWVACCGIHVMVRFVGFLVLGSTFVTGIVTAVQTHRLFAGPPVNYVDAHWPSFPHLNLFSIRGNGNG